MNAEQTAQLARRILTSLPPLAATLVAIPFLCLMLAHSQAVHAGAPIPIPQIKSALKRYAGTIGCQFQFDDRNVVVHDIDNDGKKDVVVLFFLDAGCQGGSTSGTSAFAVLDVDVRGRAFIRPELSQPAVPAFGFPRLIKRIFVRDNQLWYTAKDFDWSKDPLCCPSKPVEAPAYLRMSTLQVANGQNFAVWHWATITDR